MIDNNSPAVMMSDKPPLEIEAVDNKETGDIDSRDWRPGLEQYIWDRITRSDI